MHFLTDWWLELGGISQGQGRERPTTSIRRGDRRESEDDVPTDLTEVEAFPEGLIDSSLLLSYCDHVVYNLWEGEVSIFDL